MNESWMRFVAPSIPPVQQRGHWGDLNMINSRVTHEVMGLTASRAVRVSGLCAPPHARRGTLAEQIMHLFACHT
jgi:hypothetical protein